MKEYCLKLFLLCKKSLVIFCLINLLASNIFAQDIFLTLDKHSERTEKLPVNVKIISRNDIEVKHVETLGELLQNEVGINFQSEGGAGAVTSVTIRGTSYQQTLVLIDGRKINDISLGGADITSISTNIIERIEIIRGSGAAIYGAGAFGGVINVITKKATDISPIIAGTISYGSFNTFSPYLDGAYATDKYAVFASISNISSDGDRDNSNFTDCNSFFSGQFNISDMSKLSLTGNIYGSKLNVCGSLAYPTPKNKLKNDNKYVQLEYNHIFDEICCFNIRGYLSNNMRYFYDATKNSYSVSFNEEINKYNSDTCGINVDFHYKEHTLVGLEFENDCYKENKNLSGHNLNKNRGNYATYMQFNLPISKFTLIPGIRYDNNTKFGDVATPSISVILNAGGKVKISANTGKVWRAPTFADLYCNQQKYKMYGNPDLTPEHGISSDLGIEYAYNKVRLMSSVYYINSKDLIIWATNDETHVKNIDKAKQYGVEFEAGYIMTSYLNCKLNYTYLKSENEITHKTLTYRPANTINYNITVKPLKNLSLTASLFYKSKVFTNGENTKSLDDFITLNINLNYKINDNLSFWVKGLNIGDAKYELQKDYPMPGIAIYSGINLKILR
ncbi:MAG: TonB-dependent receptor [Endomicrobium sp.]|nr:TonB-dependent receptor [Endomicrobium sp.]